MQRQKACAPSFPIRRAGQQEHTRDEGHGRGPSTIANNRFPLWVNSKHPEVALRASLAPKPLSINTALLHKSAIGQGIPNPKK
ncbi:hypothetical protein, partial [Acidovorax sp. IB03]|uniref:hypothetical protein n=1 Tax=Acidovorax sp. IB03 TaxID=2779366 RepID=UPI001E62677F